MCYSNPIRSLCSLSTKVLLFVAFLALTIWSKSATCEERRQRAVGSSEYADLSVLTNKAERQMAKHHYREAKALLEKARVRGEGMLAGDSHGSAADIVEQLVIAYRQLGIIHQVVDGEFSQAEADYGTALRLLTKLSRDNSVWFSPEDLRQSVMEWLARVNMAEGRLNEALAILQKSSAEEEVALMNSRRARSVQREEFGGTGGLFGMRLESQVECNIATTLALELNSTRPDSVSYALQCILRNKEREADITGEDTALLRREFPEEFSQYARYASLASKFELDSWLSDHGWVKKLSAEERIEAGRTTTNLLGSASHLLLRASAKRSDSVLAQPPLTVEAVQNAVPLNAVLVEFHAYRPFNPTATLKNQQKMWLSPRYVAYLLRPTGEPLLVELGLCRDIDHLIGHFRFLMDPLMSPEEIKRIARELDAALMAPMRHRLPNADLLLIAPDGMLDLLPFEALVDEKQRYLVETLAFNYLTSGRDLLKSVSLVSARSAPVFVGYPCFDTDGSVPNDPKSDCRLQKRAQSPRDYLGIHGQREWNLSSNRFDSREISSTLEEVSEIAKDFPGSTLLTGPDATEAAIKRVAGPIILHVATHGFFVRNHAEEKERKLLDDDTVAIFDIGVEEPPKGAIGESTPAALTPLVRSGLALSGANALRSLDNNDGILTALEVSTLDLSGTQLVTLSACQTGLADPSYGGSVTGLRRAFSIAGAQSQVVSLWSINDGSARDLMIDFYHNLVKGLPVFEAMRQAQLVMLRGKNVSKRHPYYWAPFQSSGARSTFAPQPASSGYAR